MNEKPVILFESYPDFSGSPLEIYNELIKRGYENKYDLIWAVYSTFNEKTNYKIIKFFGCNTQEKQNILSRTKIIIDSNRYIQKPNSSIFRLHTRHGCSFKKCTTYYSHVGPVDAIITTSDDMKLVDQRVWAPVVKDKFIITGLPSLDRLFSKVDLYSNGFMNELFNSNKRFNKIFGWLPTFRMHRGAKINCGRKFKYGLPAIDSINDFEMLNEMLIKHNCALIVQMHHAQENNYQKLPQCSNIAFVTESIKKKYMLTTHSLMSAFDGLITDFSAAYHEYIILNRPIGIIVNDLVEYSRDEGFCYNFLEWIKGEYILDVLQLCSFIENVANDNDVAKVEREKSLHKIHKFIDNKSTDRVIQYISSVL